MNKQIASKVNNILKNELSFYILIGSVLLYIVALPYVDYDLLQLINSLPVKLVFALLVIYCSTLSPCVSIIVLLIYVLSIQQYNTTKNIEGFTDIINKFKKMIGSGPGPAKIPHVVATPENVSNSRIDNLCSCPEIKDQPKHVNDKDPKDTRNYNINDWPIFTPIVPVK